MIRANNNYVKWQNSNIDDLQNLFDLYCDNIVGFLNITDDAIYKREFFNDFCKFIWNNTSNDLKLALNKYR
jgi:hypothetical protein